MAMSDTECRKIEHIYLCDDCHDRLLALGVEIWQFTISSLLPKPCYFCGKPTQDFYEPTLIIGEKVA
jgi:hypothetical protein